MNAPFRPRETALRLREIASKVRCMPPPSRRDPEAFHIARSEHAHSIDEIAKELWPEGANPNSTITDLRRPKPPNTNGMPRSPRHK